ncbi:hypothetical protein [Phyllobacterium sp. SB3]|uniref:hypothetical protein n=1 Tax=Phyllobacterium sp. SB3 TaxID=3156073 RepID=UPI0032AF42AF
MNREILFGIRCAEVEAMEIENWPIDTDALDEHHKQLDDRKLSIMQGIATSIEQVIGGDLQERNSDHKGTYYRLKSADRYLELRENMFPAEEYEPIEPDFAQYPFLLYISEIENYPTYPDYLAAIQRRQDIFVKLRTTEV